VKKKGIYSAPIKIQNKNSSLFTDIESGWTGQQGYTALYAKIPLTTGVTTTRLQLTDIIEAQTNNNQVLEMYDAKNIANIQAFLDENMSQNQILTENGLHLAAIGSMLKRSLYNIPKFLPALLPMAQQLAEATGNPMAKAAVTAAGLILPHLGSSDQ